MSESSIVAIVTILVNLAIQMTVEYFRYQTRHKELENILKEKKLSNSLNIQKYNYENAVLLFQNFSRTTSATLAKIEQLNKNRNQNQNPTSLPLEELMKFESALYDVYFLLKNEDEQKHFITFRDNVRNFCGYKRAEGCTYEVAQKSIQRAIEMEDSGSYIYLPNGLYQDFDNCILFLQKVLDDIKHEEPYQSL